MFFIFNILILLFFPQPEEDWYIVNARGEKIGYVHVKTETAGDLTVVEEKTVMKNELLDREIYFAVKLKDRKNLSEFIYMVSDSGKVKQHFWGFLEDAKLKVLKKQDEKMYSGEREIPENYVPVQEIFKDFAKEKRAGLTRKYSSFDPQTQTFHEAAYSFLREETIDILNSNVQVMLIEEKIGSNVTSRWINHEGKLLKSYSEQYDFEIVLSDKESCLER